MLYKFIFTIIIGPVDHKSKSKLNRTIRNYANLDKDIDNLFVHIGNPHDLPLAFIFARSSTRETWREKERKQWWGVLGETSRCIRHITTAHTRVPISWLGHYDLRRVGREARVAFKPHVQKNSQNVRDRFVTIPGWLRRLFWTF